MSLQAQVHLETLFILDRRGRIASTREPSPGPGPEFALIRRADSCAWALGSGVVGEQARELIRLAQDESPTPDFRLPPKHLEEYQKIVCGEVETGPAFEFPDLLKGSDKVALVDDIETLLRSFEGWTMDEIPGRSPIMGVIEDDMPRSICFCARVSELAAEAGVETTPEYRGRGFAGLVTSAWAASIRATGRIPIYSTSWGNAPSLAVARKLNLIPCASYWSITGQGILDAS